MTKSTLRLRVFAGPNGSGKSTIIQAVKHYKVKGIPVDFGIYVNADDIAQMLLEHKFSFASYKIQTTKDEFVSMALTSGLVGKRFTEKELMTSFIWKSNTITLKNEGKCDYLAQITADFLRRKLLIQRKKFSFETVFSHKGKLDFMKEAAQQGYKVYLYYVCTESPEINKFRVKKVRVEQGGHDVPDAKIESRYYRSLDLLYEASQIAYQAFFFDNSREEFRAFAHFKKINNKKQWDPIDESLIPEWFRKYYSDKI